MGSADLTARLCIRPWALKPTLIGFLLNLPRFIVLQLAVPLLAALVYV